LNNIDTALLVPREFYPELLKPRTPSVKLVWEISSPEGRKVDEPAMLDFKRLATDYKGPATKKPYIIIGKEDALAEFIKRYNSYRTMHSECIHTLIIKYG
jgi:hypothetical protein